MNPLSLRARSYRIFEDVDVELPEGCIAIVGENGSGKSSLINIITLALFAERGELARQLSDDSDETTVEVELAFEHAGAVYRVRRSYNTRGGGKPWLDLEKEVDGLWQPLTRESVTETQKAVNALLGLSRRTFEASAFLSQGRGAMFTEAEPGERKSILAEVLGLEVWDRLLERARSDRGRVEQELTKLHGRIEQGEHELLDRRSVVERRDSAEAEHEQESARIGEGEAELEALEREIASARETAAALVGARSAVASRTEMAKTLSLQGERLEKEIETITQTLAARADLARVAKLVPELELRCEQVRKESIGWQQARDARAAAEREAERLRREHDDVIARASELRFDAHRDREAAETMRRDSEALCQTCGQLVLEEAKDRAIEALLSAARSATAEADRLMEALSKTEAPLADLEDRARVELLPAPEPIGNIEADLRNARQAETRLAALDEQERRREAAREERASVSAQSLEAADTLTEAENEYARLRENGVELAPLVQKAEDKRYLLGIARRKLTDLTTTIARCDETLDRLGRIEAELSELREERERQLAESNLLAVLERTFGRDGVPAAIVERVAIPQIEVEANRILAELGTSFRVELRTQRALKSGEGLREALDIMVTGAGGERPYETFSGGERTRLNLSLRIALARLLAHRRGAEVRMLAIDEPDGLDAAGFEALARILQGLAGDFDRIVVISHHPEMQTAFDQTLLVSKDGERSSVETAALEAVPEAVAA